MLPSFNLIAVISLLSQLVKPQNISVSQNLKAPISRNPLVEASETEQLAEIAKDTVTLVVTNNCDTTIWPGILTARGTRPETQGFELRAGEKKRLTVGGDWIGRVWGRTNCTVNGDIVQCDTGDCGKKLECVASGMPPATLAEFTFGGGVANKQIFYDISLVDGYNIPIGITHIQAKNTKPLPAYLTNCACIATPGWLQPHNESGQDRSLLSATPFESEATNESLQNWCPFENLLVPPREPFNGVHQYPDGDITRPLFAPCKSDCVRTKLPQDCCTGKFGTPETCVGGTYSKAAKAICPDAYSFAYDDQNSTFVVPQVGGWEVVMCPKGRSTDIVHQKKKELMELANVGTKAEQA